jgi:histidinol dehydrogenase
VLVAGGAQAIAAMAYGTESVARVKRIFGPGNRFVAEAKRQAAEDPSGAAMDLPAGPSEVMVIADDSAEADFVAMDLLSQAEHGPDSQVFLVTDSDAFAREVVTELGRLVADLPRADTARQALAHGAIVTVAELSEAVVVANDYAPEHLIIAADNARALCADIDSAGSVFIGHLTPEALGDYISGTNHVLPTGGWARSHAGLSLTDFMRRMTVQEASAEGLRELGPPGARLAAHEGLDAHRLAIQLRLDRLEERSR